MSEEASAPRPCGSKIYFPGDSMMGFDSPKEVDLLKINKTDGPMSPLESCTPDPFDSPPPIDSASNAESPPVVEATKKLLMKIENGSDSAQRSSLPVSPYIPRLNPISRAQSDLDITAASIRGLTSSTPIATPKRRDSSVSRSEDSFPCRRRISYVVSDEARLKDYLQERRLWLEEIKQPLKSLSIRQLKRSLSSSNISKQVSITDEEDVSDEDDDPHENERPDPVDLDCSFIGHEATAVGFRLSYVQDEISPEELRREALKLSNVFEVLGGYENLIEDDIALEIPPWEEDDSLNEFLLETDGTDELGLPEVLTYPDVFNSKADYSGEEVDSLLERYRAHRNNALKDHDRVGSETWVDDSSACESENDGAVGATYNDKNTTKTVVSEGLANVTIIQPPPIPENVKIEVKPKSTGTKRGPLKATMAIPSMPKAGPSKAESQVEVAGNAGGSSRPPSRAPSSGEVRKVHSPFSRSQTAGTIGLRGSAAGTVGLRGSLSRRARMSYATGSSKGVPPKRALSEDTLDMKSSGSTLPVFKRHKPSTVKSSAASTSPSGLSKGVLAPVTSQRARTSAVKPVMKKTKPEVPGKENQGKKFHAKKRK